MFFVVYLLVMNLTLSNSLTYKETNLSYKTSLDTIYSSKIGSDHILYYYYEIEDEKVVLKLIASGVKAPLSQEEKDTIESGLEPLKREEEKLIVAKGSYYFVQTSPAENEELLAFLLFAESQSSSGKVYIRFFKENQLEVVMQFLFPKGE